MTNIDTVYASNHLWKVSMVGLRFRTIVRGEEEPGTESSKWSWMSGTWD